jgi:hypothetical protein
LGEHTDQILEQLGYGQSDIKQLHEENVVVQTSVGAREAVSSERP